MFVCCTSYPVISVLHWHTAQIRDLGLSSLFSFPGPCEINNLAQRQLAEGCCFWQTLSILQHSHNKPMLVCTDTENWDNTAWRRTSVKEHSSHWTEGLRTPWNYPHWLHPLCAFGSSPKPDKMCRGWSRSLGAMWGLGKSPFSSPL